MFTCRKWARPFCRNFLVEEIAESVAACFECIPEFYSWPNDIEATALLSIEFFFSLKRNMAVTATESPMMGQNDVGGGSFFFVLGVVRLKMVLSCLCWIYLTLDGNNCWNDALDENNRKKCGQIRFVFLHCSDFVPKELSKPACEKGLLVGEQTIANSHKQVLIKLPSLW